MSRKHTFAGKAPSPSAFGHIVEVSEGGVQKDCASRRPHRLKVGDSQGAGERDGVLPSFEIWEVVETSQIGLPRRLF